MANYAWTQARGINSYANGMAGPINFRGIGYADMLRPLYYTFEHQGSINLDLRITEEVNRSLAHTGLSILCTFNSGHPYTHSTGGMGQRPAYIGALLSDWNPRSRQPLAPLGNSTTPWVFNTDVRANVTLNRAEASWTIYLTITNLFNRQHVINVYNRTGRAQSDGFLSNAALSGVIVEQLGDTYVDMYKAVNVSNRQHWIFDQGYDLYGEPRQTKLGVTVQF
jgi:hypothetical protein